MRRRRSLFLTVLCLVLALAGLSSTGGVASAKPTPPPRTAEPSDTRAKTQAATSKKKPTVAVAPARPMAGELTKLSGRVGSKVARPVYLERKVGSTWRQITRGTTTKTGGWSFRVTWRWDKATVRVRLPKVKIKGRQYSQVVSASKTVTAVGQTGKLVMPTWFEVGSKIVVTSTFKPARHGRTVRLQIQTKTGWTTVATGKQNRAGLTSFTRSTSTGQVAVYRAVAATYRGAKSTATAAVRAVAGTRIPLNRAVTVGTGSVEPVDLTSDLATVLSFKATAQPAGTTIRIDQAGRVAVSAALTADPADYQLAGDGVGCLGATCDIGFRLTVTATVTDPAPAEPGTEEFSVPSPDRVKAAVPAPAGLTALRDEVVVTLGSPQTPGTLADATPVATSVGATVTGGVETIGVYELRWPEPVADMAAILTTLRATPGVASAEQSVLGGADTLDVTPVDWDDDGPAVRWPFEQIRATRAWDTADGSDIPVGIVDTGTVWTGHEDLNVAETIGDDPDAHATHVAGLACARQNDKGIVGAAWGCPITTAGLSASSPKAILESATKVANTQPRVINMSLGRNQRGAQWCVSQAGSDGLTRDLNNGYTTQFEFLFNGPVGRDIVWTLAAGNNCGLGTHSWMGLTNWSLPNVITVASFNSDKKLSSFSNFGAGVEVAGPGGVGVALTGGGEGVISTGWKSCFFGQSRCSTYIGNYGTSMAAPVVAGTVALAISANPDRSAAEIGSCITSTAGTNTGRVTARSVYPAYINDTQVVPTIPFTGPIPIVDAEAAVACAQDGPTRGDVLITGAGDRTSSGNGTDRGDLFAALTDAGHQVAIADALPDNLSGFREIWYLDTEALNSDEQDRLADFVRTGRGLFLTGEWGCCAVDSSSIALINTLVPGAGLNHSGFATDDAIDIPDTVPFGLGTTPNDVDTVQVSRSGTLVGVAAGNVVGTTDSGSTVIAAWAGDQVSGGGRIAIVMDINWVAEQYRGAGWSDFVENLARFLR